VADVAGTVRRGTALDEHARHNTTSVYTPARVFPMLPEALSTDLTSLNCDGERPAIVVDLVIAADGTLQASPPTG
jgi:exoribonuclease-2